MEVSIDYINQLKKLMHSGQYAFRDRKQKKRDFRKLWITRINAACRLNDISYSRFIEGLNKAGVLVNRKMLSEIAINDPKAFSELVKVAKDGKAGKVKPEKETSAKEVTINKLATKKASVEKEVKEVKKEVKAKKEKVKAEVKEEVKKVKKEVKEKIDYTKMTVEELKKVAQKKKISVTGMKKAEIIKALEK